jgi:hypothetical protein
MAYDFSFDTRQWWATIAACVLAVLLAFAAGFVAGMMWGRRGAPQTQATGRAARVVSVVSFP